jgi:rubrerythrin
MSDLITLEAFDADGAIQETAEAAGATRADFLKRGGVAGAGFLAGGVLFQGLLSPAEAAISTHKRSKKNDIKIANYALTLEYLEATFYTMAVKEVGGLGADEKKLARQLRDDEDAHVDALISTVKSLGGKPAAKPTFDFGKAFGDRATFLKTANTLEDTGVSAYNGAATSIESVEVLAAAGSIVQVEARHAALIRLTRDKSPAPMAFDKASEMETVLAAVKPFIKG